MLKFLGRGSAFADEQTSAVFVHDNDLVVIDCPYTAFLKLKKMDVLKYKNIYVLITHTHGDHAGGLGTFAQFVWFASGRKKKVTIIAPSDAVSESIDVLLQDIEGCSDKWYKMQVAGRKPHPWLIEAIPTTHVTTLKHRCFGYKLYINRKTVIYTGDTATLTPFMDHLTKKGSYLFTEISSMNVGVHLWADHVIPTLKQLTDCGIKVYLMHIDDEEYIKPMIKNTKIKLATRIRTNASLWNK